MAQHIIPRRMYYQIFAALLGLTGLTVAVAFLNLGPLNTVMALAIAVVKALLVILIFMHVRHSTRMTKLTIAAGLFWLAIMLALTLADYVTRGMVGIPGK